jgi:allophanate hydrolase subunit 2
MPERAFASLALAAPKRVRIVAGAQRDFFTEAEFEAFTQAAYVVGANSSRMGLRLTGRPIAHSRGANIISDAVAPGSIQIPGDGQPIVLLADRQTTGGYPKIANVISADIPALGRLKPGDTIGFLPVTLEQAVDARRQMLAEIDSLAARAMPLPTTTSDLMPRLLECNLISGVFDAAA